MPGDSWWLTGGVITSAPVWAHQKAPAQLQLLLQVPSCPAQSRQVQLVSKHKDCTYCVPSSVQILKKRIRGRTTCRRGSGQRAVMPQSNMKGTWGSTYCSNSGNTLKQAPESSTATGMGAAKKGTETCRSLASQIPREKRGR